VQGRAWQQLHSAPDSSRQSLEQRPAAARRADPIEPGVAHQVSMVVVFYCFAVTPVQLAFYWNESICFRVATYPIDMIAEAYFVRSPAQTFKNDFRDSSRSAGSLTD
jgi:hypothetical protein